MCYTIVNNLVLLDQTNSGEDVNDEEIAENRNLLLSSMPNIYKKWLDRDNEWKKVPGQSKTVTFF